MEKARAPSSSERGDIAAEKERKDAEMYEQEQRAAKSSEKLEGHDKVAADSFPASDPPSPQTKSIPND